MTDTPLWREPVLWAAPIVVATLVLPFVLGYDAVPVLANHIAFTLGIAPLALVAGGLAPAALLVLLAGLWLMVSPFVIGYAELGVAAWLIDAVAGLTVVVLAAASTFPLRRRTITQLGLFGDDPDPARRLG